MLKWGYWERPVGTVRSVQDVVIIPKDIAERG